MEKFLEFAIDPKGIKSTFGGNVHLDNCLASVEIGCSASCGDNFECYGECEQNQTGHCFDILG